jgi:hypothetical protein
MTNNIFHDIIHEVNQLEKLLKLFSEKDNYAAIDIDVALAKTRRLYEMLIDLKLNQNIPEVLSVNKEVSIIPEKLDKPNLPESVVKSKPVEHVVTNLKTEKPNIPSNEQVFIEQPAESMDATLREEEIEKKQHETKTKDNPQQSTKILADKLHTDTSVLHETMAQSAPKHILSNHLQSKPIQSIEHAIGINEKFLFIRELFNNNADEFNNTIQLLDKSDNYDQAYSYLFKKYTWDLESETTEKLIILLKRRFLE